MLQSVEYKSQHVIERPIDALKLAFLNLAGLSGDFYTVDDRVITLSALYARFMLFHVTVANLEV